MQGVVQAPDAAGKRVERQRRDHGAQPVQFLDDLGIAGDGRGFPVVGGVVKAAVERAPVHGQGQVKGSADGRHIQTRGHAHLEPGLAAPGPAAGGTGLHHHGFPVAALRLAGDGIGRHHVGRHQERGAAGAPRGDAQVADRPAPSPLGPVRVESGDVHPVDRADDQRIQVGVGIRGRGPASPHDREQERESGQSLRGHAVHGRRPAP